MYSNFINVIDLFLFQYIVSAGKDSLVKLWELSTNRCLIVYTGAGATGGMEHRAVACFNHTEDYGQFTRFPDVEICSSLLSIL